MMRFPQSLHLIENFKRSEGYVLIKNIQAIRSSYKIFSGNYADLKNALKEHEEKSRDGSMWDSDHIRWEIQDWLVRLMYNFFSSAATLVDHTRNHNRKLYNPSESVAVEYQNCIETDFKDNPLNCFIIGLRNFISHHKLPLIVSTKKTNGETAFKITKSSLNDGDWKSKAKEFKELLPEEFDVEKLVDEYFNKVKQLHEWYMLRQLQHHKEVYAKLIVKKKTLLKLATEDRITHALPFNQADIEKEEEILKTL